MRTSFNIPQTLFTAAAVISALSVVLIFGFLFITAAPVLEREGLGFLTGTRFCYADSDFGIAIFIVGTLVTTAVTLTMAVPLSFFTAVFLAEWAPVWLERIIRPLIELLVGIPSVVYGIFGFFVLAKYFRDYVNPAIGGTLGVISPIFRDPTPGDGCGILLASFVLMIMILPTITALSQEAMRAVPQEYREASFALGATKWETITKIVVPAAISGILTAIVLGLMRAMGETMAVVMLIGSTERMPTSILDTGYAMTSKILNDAGYRIGDPDAAAALFAIGAVLFLMEMGFVALTRFIGSRYSIERRG